MQPRPLDRKSSLSSPAATALCVGTRGSSPAADPEIPRTAVLTGITRSRQMLKFFLWFGFSFLSENLVSPMNSLWPNLSSSHTEILQVT